MRLFTAQLCALFGDNFSKTYIFQAKMSISGIEIQISSFFYIMTIREEQQRGLITLKEASERFGYSPDYIGQLIRKGKIPGKQVYAAVAWMITPEALKAYLETDGRPRIKKAKHARKNEAYA